MKLCNSVDVVSVLTGRTQPLPCLLCTLDCGRKNRCLAYTSEQHRAGTTVASLGSWAGVTAFITDSQTHSCRQNCHACALALSIRTIFPHFLDSWRAAATASLLVLMWDTSRCCAVNSLRGMQHGHGPCFTFSCSLFTCAFRFPGLENVLSHCRHLHPGCSTSAFLYALPVSKACKHPNEQRKPTDRCDEAAAVEREHSLWNALWQKVHRRTVSTSLPRSRLHAKQLWAWAIFQQFHSLVRIG